MKKKNLLLIALPIVLTSVIWLISVLTTQHKIIPVTYVSGKNVTEFPQAIYEGVTPDGLKKYIYYDKDTIGQRVLLFDGTTCKMELIVPKDNYALADYIIYLNKAAMPYVQGGMATPSPDVVTYARVIQGQWRLVTKDGITNIFLISGEIDNPLYFLNTADHLPYWMVENKK